MSKLLQGRLPFSMGPYVESATYNRSIRLLELSLDAFDPAQTLQFSQERRDLFKFNAGTIIFNVSVGVLQMYDGDQWVDISLTIPYTTDPLEAQGSVGVVQVINKGAIVVNVGVN